MTTHDWKSDVTGAMFDPSNYADGQAFEAGDTLVTAGGQPDFNVGNTELAAMPLGSYLFAGGASVNLYDALLPSGGIIGESTGPQFSMFNYGQFVNAGSFDIGSATQAGSVEALTDGYGGVAASFTNDGQISLQNSSLLRLYPSSASTVTNTAGAAITVDTGSALVFDNLYGYTAGSGNLFVNDGVIAVSATTGLHGSYSDIQADYAGSGTFSVNGTSGANPVNTHAEFGGSAAGSFDVASGELQFDGAGPVQGAIRFDDGDGLLNLVSNLSYSGPVPYAPLQATVNHFQAGDQIWLNGSVVYQSYGYDTSSHQLSLYSGAAGSGSVVARLTFAGQYTLGDFQLGSGDAVDGVGASSIFSLLITTTSVANGTVSVAPGGSYSGGDGNPIIETAGNATVFTGTGANTVYLAGGANEVVSHGLDTVASSTGSDTVFAAGGGVAAYGGGAGSRLEFIGEAAADTVAGGAGSTTVFGAAGGGSYTAGSGGGSVLIATAGNTTLTGGANQDAMYGSAGNGDVLQAGTQSGSGFDYLVASAGSTLMQNGSGNAVMYGGTGADRFAFSDAVGGTNWVVGFKQGTDKILLGGVSAASVLQTAIFDSSGTHFAVGASSVTVWNIQLTASDFS